MRQGNQFQSFLFFKKAFYQVRAIVLQLDFSIFRQPSNQHTLETNCLKLYSVDPEICSMLIFQIRVWKQFLQHILCMIFQQKCSSSYILLTDQISLSGCFYLRYGQYGHCNCLLTRWLRNKFKTNLIFLIKPF